MRWETELRVRREREERESWKRDAVLSSGGTRDRDGERDMGSEAERGAGVLDNRIKQAYFRGFPYGNTICRTAE